MFFVCLQRYSRLGDDESRQEAICVASSRVILLIDCFVKTRLLELLEPAVEAIKQDGGALANSPRLQLGEADVGLTIHMG